MEHDPAKRRAFYLERAEEAERMAKSAKGILAQEAFRSIADSWRSLARKWIGSSGVSGKSQRELGTPASAN